VKWIWLLPADAHDLALEGMNSKPRDVSFACLWKEICTANEVGPTSFEVFTWVGLRPTVMIAAQLTGPWGQFYEAFCMSIEAWVSD
jgi:hypothetical protein